MMDALPAVKKVYWEKKIPGIGKVSWNGESYHIDELALAPGVLVSDSNEVVFDNSAKGEAPLDIMRLDWIQVAFSAESTSTGDPFAPQPNEGTVELSEVPRHPLLFDVRNPETPHYLIDWTLDGNNALLRAYQDLDLRVVDADELLIPEDITPLNNGMLLADNEQADLIIIITDELAPAVIPLAEARIQQGLGIKIVDVNEIYDDFGFAESSPDAINKYLRHAYRSWELPSPCYVLIVGEATYDYRDYLKKGVKNSIPSPMVSVSFGGETISDARIADINDDSIPDLAVGRWPVTTRFEVRSMVQKTFAYEQKTSKQKAIFVAGGSSSEFNSLNHSIALGSDLDPEKVRQFEGIDSEELGQLWQEGPWLLTYSGHGSLNQWGIEEILSGTSVNLLRSASSSPIVLQLTCLTGFFAHPTQASISERMLLVEVGPALIISATSLTLSSSQKPFGIEFIKEFQNPELIRIGDAIVQAKQRLDSRTNPDLQEIIDTFGLLGEPSAIIVRPGFDER
jgi:hypothetical protein